MHENLKKQGQQQMILFNCFKMGLSIIQGYQLHGLEICWYVHEKISLQDQMCSININLINYKHCMNFLSALSQVPAVQKIYKIYAEHLTLQGNSYMGQLLL